MAIRGYVFDAYGTLFDVHSVVEAGRALTADPVALSMLWRQKQLEWQLEATIERLGLVEQERRMLLHRIATAVDEDRKRIAHEVHDDSLQMLTAVQLRIEQVSGLTDPGLIDEDARARAERPKLCHGRRRAHAAHVPPD